MRKKTSVSFLALRSRRERGAGSGEGVLVGQRMAALEVAEAPVAGGGQLVGTTDAAQALAALHAIEQDLEHGAGSLAESDDENPLVGGEIDGGGAAAVRHQAVQRVAIEAQAAVEGGSNVARLERAGKDVSGRGVHGVESGIADRGHGSSSLDA